MRRAGFTLPETIVAMTLFTAAAVALCQAALNARHALMRLEHRKAGYMRIDWVRDNILAITDRETLEKGGQMTFPQHVRKSPLKGAEEDAPTDTIQANWEVEIFPTSVLDVHQLNITLTVEHGEEMAEPQEASYYVYRPGWYEETDNRNTLLKEKQDAWERLQLDRGF